MLTVLATTDLGPVSLAAPTHPPRHVVAEHGHLWQWVDGGDELISLSVAVRETRLGTPTGVRHHLNWEIGQVRTDVTGGSDEDGTAPVLVHVEGAVGAAAADVRGRMRGVDVHNRLVVTTDGRHMHVLRMLVPATEAGRELVEAVTSGLRVRAWTMPA